MATVVGGYIFTALAGAGATVGVAAVIATTVGQLIVGTVVALVSAALTRASIPGREELKRDLSTPTSRPPFRFVYGETRAVGSLVSWPVVGNVLWGCWLLNSRPSDLSNLSLVLDDREVAFSGDPFDFDDLDGAMATEDPFLGYVNFWVQQGHETSPPQRFLNDVPYDEVNHPEYYKSTDAWQGRTVVWIRLDAGPNTERQKRWPSAPPIVEMDAKWSNVYDPREISHDIDDATTWEPSDNQGLVLLDVLLNNPVRQYQPLSLSLDSFEWGADVADETVALKSGGSEKRYRVAGTVVFSDGVELEDMLEPVLIGGAAKLTRIGGKLGMIPATPKLPVQTINDVIDGIMVDWLQPSKGLPTHILGSYVSVARGYEDADLPPYEIPGAQADDGGVRKTRSLRMAMVESPTQAQRLVKIMGYDARRQKVISTVISPKHLNLISGSEVTVAFPSDYSAINGEYEVTRIHPEINVDNDGVMLRSSVEMLIVDDTGLTWDAATEEVDIYDELFDLGLTEIEPPGPITVTTINNDTGGTFINGVRFEFAPSPTASVATYGWEYRLDDGDWYSGGLISSETLDADGDVFGQIDGMSPVAEYDIRVRALSPNGYSAYRTLSGVNIGFSLTNVTMQAGTAKLTVAGDSSLGGNPGTVRLYIADVGDDFTLATQVGNEPSIASDTAFTVDIGDVDAINEITNGDFSSGSTGWIEDGTWVIGSGVATHTAGSPNEHIETSVTLDAGEDYRFTYTRTGANNTSVEIVGTTDVTSDRTSVNGLHQDVLTAPASPTAFRVLAVSTFAGTVDDIYLVKDTPDALPQGQKDYWVVPVTQTGSEGSPVGPFTLTIF